MLLGYHFDTKDTDLLPQSIELRKRIGGRKLQTDIDAGKVDSDVIRVFKEKNASERREQGREQYTVAKAGHAKLVSLQRMDQQLNIEKRLKALENDLTSASRLSKTRYAHSSVTCVYAVMNVLFMVCTLD